MSGSDNSSDFLSSSNQPDSKSRLRRAAPIIIVGSVMFHFISYWRVAAVVLCDMSSTVFYIGAIVESAIGKAAPWFIIAVLLFSYAMRAVYIESCSLFVRGGVYRVVKEAMGGFLAKLSVSALLFDYVLTGPISGVSAGQYIVGLGLEAWARFTSVEIGEGWRLAIKSWGSAVIACLTTLYFFRQNLRGIPESSSKALKIMIATTVMGVIMLLWSGVTLAVKGPVNEMPSWKPDLSKKVEIDAAGQTVPKLNPLTGEQEDPLGFLGRFPSLAEPLRKPGNWWSLVGIIGLIFAFGHSILAMSGEETLAQVYREVESPKLPNFEKAAFIVFLYSLLLTGTMNFLAVLMVPDRLRMKDYYDNWMGGLAMQMVGPPEVLLLLNAFVVVIGFLILSGAVNTSIIGSNGVLSRVAEDGVLPDWFLKPHRRYGTNSRILWLITGMQLLTIIVSAGDMILLGEAYAFGVIWSFVFKTLSMVVLRFKDRSHREFKVPLNVRLGNTEVPIGLGLITLVVFLSALANLPAKQVATVSGVLFTGVFLAIFMVTERYYSKRRGSAKHEHIEQFTEETAAEVSIQALALSRPYRKLVAIRSPQNLYMLQKSLEETDPETTDVVVMTAKSQTGQETVPHEAELDKYDQRLMTAVIELGEKAGKPVKPLVVPTNNAMFAIVNAARAIQAQELIIGASNKFTAEELLDQMAFYWINQFGGEAPPLTIRVRSRNLDAHSDIGGGCRIPTITERKARTAAELRAAGIGINRVLLAHDGTAKGSDLFENVLTVLDPGVILDLVQVQSSDGEVSGIGSTQASGERLAADRERAAQLGREVEVHTLSSGNQENVGAEIVRLVREHEYGLVILGVPTEGAAEGDSAVVRWSQDVLEHTSCLVFLAEFPSIPRETDV